MFGKQNVPTWASFFTHEQYATFLAEVSNYLSERNIDGTIDDGTVNINQGDQRLGLQNLAQICNQNDGAQWREIVFQHFDSVYSSIVEEDFSAAKGASFEQIRSQLAVRLQPDQILNSEASEHIVYRVHLPGTVSLLALDMPTAISSVTWEMVQGWNKTVDELFEIALDNIKQQPFPKPDTVTADDGTELISFFGDDFFVTTRALFFSTQPDLLGAYGSLVAVPHRHAMLCYPIYDMEVLSAISTMLPATIGMYSEGPGSLSAQLYWYDGEEFMLLPYQLDGAQLNFEPPLEFVQMLENLSDAN